MIPKLFHWAWLGEKPLPDQFREWMHGWIKLHKDWGAIIWNNDNLFKLDNQSVFDACKCVGARTDILRLEIVLRFGGIYLDIDFECLRNINGLRSRQLLLPKKMADAFDLSVFGAVPDHPFIQHMVDRLPQIYDEARDTGRNVANATSMAVTNKCMATWKPRAETIDDQRVFFPYEFSEPNRLTYPETVAIHHGAHSWCAENQI